MYGDLTMFRRQRRHIEFLSVVDRAKIWPASRPVTSKSEASL
jgi:hypothetical protein